MAVAVASRNEIVLDYWPHGAARELWRRRDPELLVSGPAGTGKSYACLQKLHMAALNHPGMRGLMVRKTAVSLTASALVTYQERVLHPLDGVRFYGGSRAKPAAFIYPNGSQILVGGLDKATKIMSTEYDMIYVQEATELTDRDWEALTTRLRYGVMPYQQLIADCNPDVPTHWLKQRCDRGDTALLESRHRDNPMLWDVRAQAWTRQGAEYMATLDRLTGVRRTRLLDGIWAAAEGQVYEGWDPVVHIVDRYDIPVLWPRYWVIDFGFVNPFVWQAWAQRHDGELVMYREVYLTRRLVSQHARRILQLTAGEPAPVAVITDHDAEDRATFEQETGFVTTPAKKNVKGGIEVVANRLGGDGVPTGRPRIAFMRDSLDQRDASLAQRGLPASTVEEFPSYVWETRGARGPKEAPVKEQDHGMDAVRYLVAHFDLTNQTTDMAAAVAAMQREWGE